LRWRKCGTFGDALRSSKIRPRCGASVSGRGDRCSALFLWTGLARRSTQAQSPGSLTWPATAPKVRPGRGAGSRLDQWSGGVDVSLRYLHTMVRVTDIKQSLDFYCTKLGMEEVRRVESEAGRYTLVFLAAPVDKGRASAERAPLLELTFNWDPEKYGEGRNFGHLAYEVDDLFAVCDRCMKAGVTINHHPHA